jgi:transcriptional regulator with XRE-family HTH domain
MAVMTLLASPDDDGLGRRLAALRVAAGLTQAKLAGHLGLSVRQVERTEHGRKLADGRLIERWVGTCGGCPDDVREAVAALPEVMVLNGPESAQEAP